VHEGLLPHSAALDIVDVVDLVRHHAAEIVELHVVHRLILLRRLCGGSRRGGALGGGDGGGGFGGGGLGGGGGGGVGGGDGRLDELVAQDLIRVRGRVI